MLIIDVKCQMFMSNVRDRRGDLNISEEWPLCRMLADCFGARSCLGGAWFCNARPFSHLVDEGRTWEVCYI